MIEFNCLIHKDTGTVIKYENWKEKLEKVDLIIFNNYAYEPDEILLMDDFGIIYDSEFTREELIQISEDNEELSLEVKINKLIDEKEKLKDKYGIEV